MRHTPSLSVSALLVVAIAVGGLGGCAGETTEDSASAADEIRTTQVVLPVGDPCRDALAPLALGLADGIGSTAPITVSLSSETEVRVYNIDMEGFGYEVTLDNDSHSMCFFEELKRTDGDDGNGARKSAATRKERSVDNRVTAPRGDDCGATVRLLAQGLANGAVGRNFIDNVNVTLDSATDTRDYTAFVNGKDFDANGHHFPNDERFTLELDNDSASKCVVLDIKHAD